MAFESFQKKQRVLNELMEALGKIEEMLPELTSVEMQELLTGLEKLITTEQGQRRSAMAHDVHQVLSSSSRSPWTQIANSVFKPREGEFPPPTRAVELLLATAPKEGLSANEIVIALEGKIKTASAKPRDVLYSALAHLKSEGRIAQLSNKNYVPSERNEDKADGEDEDEGEPDNGTR